MKRYKVTYSHHNKKLFAVIKTTETKDIFIRVYHIFITNYKYSEILKIEKL